jgi:hypothetical protein
MTTEDIKREIANGVRYATSYLSVSLFASEAELLAAEKKKSKLENDGWDLLNSYPGLSVYVKRRDLNA